MSPDIGSLPAEWAAFLQGLDLLLPEPVRLVCIVGFVLRVMYRIPRITADIDCISILPFHDLARCAIPKLCGAKSCGYGRWVVVRFLG
jgi:hypothetical protein